SSPASKRSIKPSQITTAPPQYPVVAEASALQPLSSPNDAFGAYAQPTSPTNSRKRRASGQQIPQSIAPATAPAPNAYSDPVPTQMQAPLAPTAPVVAAADPDTPAQPPPKKGRTNTPWTPAEEQRLKQMRDAGNSWSEIAKSFPQRTEGSVKKHWYKDMHYAEFAADEEAALLAAIKEYEANKWKEIGKKVGKPAKACEQYAKEHFGGKV
ncbi:hypothetical protein NA57DRAFT_44374, partial [Rhizodiscina lignyota]